MKAAIYARVSTSEQTPDNQIQALTSWADSRGYQIVATYQESESAWRDGHQRELAQLRQEAGRGKFDILLVWALDRLTREGALKVLQLVQWFQLCGVKIMSYQEPWTQAEGPMTELLYSITAWVARYESERRSERTKAGMARKARECGGRIPPRGPDKKKRKRRRPREPLWEGG
jgi:DNA invertase Pin-like site-specific DNA recombinase